MEYMNPNNRKMSAIFTSHKWSNLCDAGWTGVESSKWKRRGQASAQACVLIKKAISPRRGKFVFRDADGNECVFDFEHDEWDEAGFCTNMKYGAEGWEFNPDFRFHTKEELRKHQTWRKLKGFVGGHGVAHFKKTGNVCVMCNEAAVTSTAGGCKSDFAYVVGCGKKYNTMCHAHANEYVFENLELVTDAGFIEGRIVREVDSEFESSHTPKKYRELYAKRRKEAGYPVPESFERHDIKST